MVFQKNRLIIVILFLVVFSGQLSAKDKRSLKEFEIKRESVYEFNQKPKITRNGDKITIDFETKSFCDVTIAIENTTGNIVCHLANGVLGPNAPKPFKINSKIQKITWNGKRDDGTYIDDKTNLIIRVSLGLKARYEKPLFWEPKKRVSQLIPQIRATKEGVYVFDSSGSDHCRLFSHEGKYIRTIYPFPSSKIKSVKGLGWKVYPQDGKKLPVKKGTQELTLLTSGTTGIVFHGYKLGKSEGAYSMDVRNGQIALAGLRLNRLATDGSSGDKNIYGPTVYSFKKPGMKFKIDDNAWVPPTSIAFSPDSKWLYLTGYAWGGVGCHSGVMRMKYNDEKSPELFAGVMDIKKGSSKEGQFNCATSVDCDKEGRVYITDFLNDRIQIFSPAGKLLKIIATTRPALVRIHKKSGEIYCFSWAMMNHISTPRGRYSSKKIKPTLTIFGTFAEPKKRKEISLPLPDHIRYVLGHGAGKFPVAFTAEIDSWATPTVIWLGKEAVNNQVFGVSKGNGGATMGYAGHGIKLFKLNKDKLEKISDFGEDTVKSIVRATPPAYLTQKLYVNPKNHHLYIAEGDTDTNKSTRELLEIIVETNKVKKIKLPFPAEDLCFDLEGLIYLRTHKEVARYNPKNWKDIPWDYGEERKYLAGTKVDSPSILILPATKPVTFHQNGMWINPKRHLSVSCTNYRIKRKKRKVTGLTKIPGGHNDKYIPQIYAGRARWNEIHVWDKRGKILFKDALPGLNIHEGLAIDKNDNLYAMASKNRTGYFNPITGTLLKVVPKKAKIYTEGTEIKMEDNAKPKRTKDMKGSWIENGEWIYGGVGFMGQNFPAPTKCDCCRTRFTLDLFDRSFAPEVGHHSVAVLDTNGNLILRIGQYGNENDGIPLVPHPSLSNPKSIGGDEVALFYGAYLATDTDRRLFIADIGNARIVSVKLDYHLDFNLSLKEE
ncbi:MAG: hypothetical protein COA79_06020 [Planctomycetota bacterium]|nr:MAG: hypothetical protein COA79_06020 [Planctomycetota bacterium]